MTSQSNDSQFSACFLREAGHSLPIRTRLLFLITKLSVFIGHFLKDRKCPKHRSGTLNAQCGPDTEKELNTYVMSKFINEGKTTS